MLVYCVLYIEPIRVNHLHFLLQIQQESANDLLWAEQQRFKFRYTHRDFLFINGYHVQETPIDSFMGIKTSERNLT